MIKATVEEVRAAFSAFNRINEEVRLSKTPAWRVSRMIGKLKPIVRDFERTQMKLYRDAGGMVIGGGVQIEVPERGKDESDEDWKTRRANYRDSVNTLQDEVDGLNEEEVEVDYDPIPLAMFDDEDGTPKEKRRQYSANDFANAGPFIKE